MLIGSRVQSTHSPYNPLTVCQKISAGVAGRGRFGTLARIYVAIMSCIVIPNVRLLFRSRHIQISESHFIAAKKANAEGVRYESEIFLEGRASHSCHLFTWRRKMHHNYTRMSFLNTEKSQW